MTGTDYVEARRVLLIAHTGRDDAREVARAFVKALTAHRLVVRLLAQEAGELGLDRIVSSQPQYSALYRVIEAEVLPLCKQEGIGQIVWSPMAQGVLTGKYLPGQAPPADSRGGHPSAGGSMKQYLTDDVLTRVQQLRPIAEDLGLSMAQLSLAWVLANGNVAAAIIGATRPEQVHDNVAAAGVELSADVLARIDEVLGDVVERDPGKTSRG